MKNIVIVIYVVFSMYSLNAIATDDYMSMLEAEAEGSELDHGGQLEVDGERYKKAPDLVARKWQGECDYESDVLPIDLVREEFSSYMKKCTLSIYVFYHKLDTASQQLVYENYKKASPIKLSSLRKSVLVYF